jgi:hypothetical protein
MTFQSLLDNNIYITRGSVFKWFEYEFSADNSQYETKDKYWITLNCKVNDFPINAVLPTSQYNNHYYSNPAHLIDTVIFEKGESQYFNSKKTIIDLKNIIEEDEYIIKEAYEAKYLIHLGDLEPELLTKIEEVIRNSDEIDLFKINEYLCIDVD